MMRKALTFSLFAIFAGVNFGQNVGINTTGANPDNSAMLDVVSTSRGMLVPRVALTATNAAGPITAPATSLLVYNTATAGAGATAVTPGFYYWDGNSWERFDTSNNEDDWKLTGNANTTAGTNFLGTTNGQALDFRTNNVQRFRVANGNQVQAMSDGTNALPFYSWQADTDMGIYRIGANDIGISTGGVERVSIANGLTVFNETSTDTDFRVESNGNTHMIFTDAGTDRVSIGSANTDGTNDAEFNVTGNSTFSDDIRLRDGATNAGDYLVHIYDSNDDGVLDILENNGMNHRIHGNGTTIFNEQGLSLDLRMEGNTDANLFFLDASTDRIGIGTNTPAEELHVIGDARVSSLAGAGNRVVIADANGTLNDVPAGTNGQVLMQTATGPAFGSSTNINSTSLGAADIQISSGTFTNVPGMTLTFTATQTTALLMFTGSGFAFTNSMSSVSFRIRNGAVSLGGTNTAMQSYDDVTGTITSWNCSFTRMITGLTIGTTYTYTLQGSVNGIFGTPNAAVFAASFPDTHHLTMSIIQ